MLSFRIAEAMRREGLDLTTNSALTAPMTESQKNQLREAFNAIATGFRKASSQSVSTPPAGDLPTGLADRVDRSTGAKIVK